MASHRPGKTSLVGKLLLAAILGAIIALLVAESGKSASSASANRCPTTSTTKSAGYHCVSAYPEAFYVAGYAQSSYRLGWNISCSGRSVTGGKTVRGAFKLIVNQSTLPGAYQLMISHDVCKIDVVATRTSGSGSIHLVLEINQNHALPVHN